MQSVVRSSLIGLLAIASLTACGDKVNVVGPSSTTPASVVHAVVVTPISVLNLAVGASVTFAAAVDADAAVTDRTVTWTSADPTVATVDANGKVTGVKVGTTTIIAAAKADANVKGSALVTVVLAGGAAPTVSIQQINAGGTITPVIISNVVGQIDVLLNVDASGQPLKSITATVKCGNDSVTQTQSTVSGNSASLDANEAAAALQVFSFNTAAFTVNPTTGAVTVPLHNGQCTVAATATTAANQSATTTQQFTLNNLDGVVIANSFAPITNAEAAPQPTQANDAFGLPWRSGSVTVTATPVLYNANRTISSVSIQLPGSTNDTQTLTAAPFAATWSGSATSGSRVTGLTLTAACNPLVGTPPTNGCEANNSTPLGIAPKVIALDANGNDLALNVLNGALPGLVNTTTFRLDNTAPEAPLAFNTPGRQSGWVNASYVFTGVGVGSNPTGSQLGGNGSITGTENFVSCGDGPSAATSPFACVAQVGVSASSHGAVGVGTGSTNGNTTFTYYAVPAASFVPISTTNGTGTTASACALTIPPWKKITTAGDLDASIVSTAYVIRVFEADKLGNERCTDLVIPPATAANLGTMINTGVAGTYTANAATFGVDKGAPTDSLLTPGNPACGSPNTCAGDLGKYTTNPVPFFTNSPNDPDAASGLSATPLTTKLVRFAIDPATNAPATVNSAFGCPIGFSASAGTCGTAAAGTSIAVDAGSSAGVSSLVDGYYTYTATIMDRARNVGPTVTRQVVVDRIAPTMLGIGLPPTINGGQTASFPASATDNLDLVGTSYLLSYAVTPLGSAVPLSIRAAGNDIGVAFDNTLTVSAQFTLNVPAFVRTIAATDAAGAPPNSTGTFPGSIAVNVVDAAGNSSNVNTQAIPAANINQTALTNFFLPVNGLSFSGTGFSVSNVAANISNCPSAGCAGNAAPANPTSVVLTATVQGQDSPTFQFANPFTSISFYYLSAANEYTLIGTVTAPSGAIDNVAQTQRTYTFSLGTAFDPPAGLVSPLKIIAVGVNSKGDALVTNVNTAITLTNP
jgi:hypothetical protein